VQFLLCGKLRFAGKGLLAGIVSVRQRVTLTKVFLPRLGRGSENRSVFTVLEVWETRLSRRWRNSPSGNPKISQAATGHHRTTSGILPRHG